MKTKLMIYRELELIPEPTPQPHPLFNWLRRIWNSLLDSSTNWNQPRIWATTTPTGKLYWCVHDPIDGSTVYLESENDAGEWLERRYYR